MPLLINKGLMQRGHLALILMVFSIQSAYWDILTKTAGEPFLPQPWVHDVIPAKINLPSSLWITKGLPLSPYMKIQFKLKIVWTVIRQIGSHSRNKCPSGHLHILHKRTHMESFWRIHSFGTKSDDPNDLLRWTNSCNQRCSIWEV